MRVVAERRVPTLAVILMALAGLLVSVAIGRAIAPTDADGPALLMTPR